MEICHTHKTYIFTTEKWPPKHANCDYNTHQNIDIRNLHKKHPDYTYEHKEN